MTTPVTFRRAGIALLVGLLSLFVFAGVAAAHAELETATPADGATVDGTPPKVSGVYSEPMTADGSSLKLVDSTGAQVATGGVVTGDATKMAIEPVPDLAAGTYTVQSTTVSASDGDIDRMTWTFTVTAAATPSSPATPSAAASPVATATATASAVAAPSPTASADGGAPAGSSGDVLLPIVAGIVIVGAIGLFLFRRRDRPSSDS